MALDTRVRLPAGIRGWGPGHRDLAYPLDGHVLEMVSGGVPLTINGTHVVPAVAPWGVGMRDDGTAGAYLNSAALPDGTANSATGTYWPISCAFGFSYVRTAANGRNGILNVAGTAASATPMLLIEDNSGDLRAIWNGGAVGTVAGFFTNGVPHRIWGVIRRASQTLASTRFELWADGVLRGSTTGETLSTGNKLFLHSGFGGISKGILGNVQVHVGRVPTPEELVAEWSANPHILDPCRVRPLLVNSAGGSTFNQAVAASNSALASLVRQAGKPLAASDSAAATLLRATAKSAAASSAPITTLVRQTGKPLAASTAALGSLVRQTAKSLAASDAAVASLAAIKVVLKSLQASSAPAATLVRQAGKPLAASTAAAATMGRQVAKALAASVVPLAGLARSTAKSLQALAATLASLIASAAGLTTPTRVTLSDARIVTASLSEARLATASLSDARVVTVTLTETIAPT